MSEPTNAQAKEALKAVFQKAAVDADFRAKCLSDPQAAIKEATGLDVPAGMKIKVVEPSSDIIVSLPSLGTSEESLEEEVLASMAGGARFDTEFGCSKTKEGESIYACS